MTRFVISLDEACNRIFEALKNMRGGEIFIPKMPSIKLTDLAKSISPDSKLEEIGLRVGEKIHEDMITSIDAPNTYDYENFYITYPNSTGLLGRRVSHGFEYRSDNNTEWIKEVGGVCQQK